VIAPHLVAGFLLGVLPLVVTPGASFTLLVRHVAVTGSRAGPPVILGTVTGLYVHAALAAAGLSALVMQASWAFTTVRLAGAVYLITLGVWTWRTPRRNTAPPVRGRNSYTQALLGNVLNPKAAMIFLTLTPQFVDPDQPLWPQILIFVTAQSLLVALWLSCWSFLVGRTQRTWQSARFGQTLRHITAATLIGLGARTAIG
jgi:threonine/homoserine/homoserine lactone efflux protein